MQFMFRCHITMIEPFAASFEKLPHAKGFAEFPRIWRRALPRLLAVGWFALGATSSFAADDLATRIQPLIDAHDGQLGVAIKHLSTNETFTHRADTPMPTASLIKFPLMIATYQAVEAGQLDLEQKITLRETDKVPGSGILTPHFSAGASLSLNDTVHLMIVYSDNTATNLVVDQVGLAATAQVMESLDCGDTKLHSQVYRRETSIFPERSQQFGLGSTSAADMLRLYEALHAGTLVSAAASKQMLAHLYQCDDKTMCARELPAGTKFAHKSGAVSAVRTDAGLIDSPSGPIAICVLTANNEDQRWSGDNAAQVLAGKIARAAYDYFNPAASARATDDRRALSIGSNGRLVEALQRTLNARCQPSPGLAVDGDFGPGTQGAVMAFQRANNLPASGQVDAKTWEALGPLVSSDPALPAPAEINAQQIEMQPADPLTGPPFVTCKAWAIGDAKTGKLLWGFQADEPRDMASTTKIMTAFLVTRLAEQAPAILDETVTFSQRADDTIGSTAGVRAGEELPVGELLYGLLLPSGNDASVALAEHFGKRLAAAADAVAGDAYDHFIDAMNRTARELGLDKSSFKNPNGLPAPQHQTSAHDLFTLSTLALRQPCFRQIVGTVQHGCTVVGPGGYQRNLVWRNSNRLLRTAGYDGVKTGTTSAAGSCLVSHGSRGDRSLLVVVLGSSSSDARYADTRNLYRWAWQQLDFSSGAEQPPVVLTDEARRIHQAALLIDGHNDLPWELRAQGSLSFDKLDLAQPQEKLQTDIPRLRAGGVGAQFWSVYVPADTAYNGTALSATLEQIEMVNAMIARYPETFARALTADDIERIHRSGRIASMIGVEGGHCIENSLSVLGQLYRLGARYMTLTHSDTLDWADSATDEFRHGGLTPFGEDVVREMNRLGMMVDLSHVSPDTMKHALRITRAPVVFSHSSSRAVADHPRNVPDDVLRLVAENDGVVMVNFFSGFIVPAAADIYSQSFAFRREQEKLLGDPKKVDAAVAKWRSTRPMPRGTIHDLVDHIDHIVKVAGIDHVGLGSDYDGVSVLPAQMDDVSSYPLITQALLDRGYGEADINKILGQNLLRVMRETEQVARQIAASQ